MHLLSSSHSRTQLASRILQPTSSPESNSDVPQRQGGMEQYGNTTTYNLELVLVQNIKRGLYWERKVKDIMEWSELVDEIYDSVDNVEPWMSGNARGPSTAFNLIFRLGQLKPDVRQVRQMLDHRDSPYIRAVGFLYLRYACDPRKLWHWFKPYMRDEEEFEPSPSGLGTSVNMGEYARDILLDQFYFETIFPRVPKTVHDEIVGHLKDMGLPHVAKGNGGQGGPDRRGVNDEGNKRPASVKASLSVAMGQRAPNRAGTREQGRGMGAELQHEKRGSDKPAPPPWEDRRRDDRRDDRGGRDDDRRREADDRCGRDSRDDRRERDLYVRRSRSRERHDDDRRDDRRNRDRDYYRRDDRRRSPDRRRGPNQRRRPDRRQRSSSRDARDAFRERAAAVHVDADKIQTTYG